MISFFVPGVPCPKGSTRSFAHSKTGRIITRASNAERLEPWEGRIAAVALSKGLRVTNAPCRVSLTFQMPRPKSHFGARGLKASAPRMHAQKPDLDKLVRAVLDALTGVAWADDQQVVEIAAVKWWGSDAGVAISIEHVATAATDEEG